MRRPAAAIVLVTALSVIVPRSAAAQRQPAPASREGSPSAEAAPATSSAFDAEELRQQLERLLDQYPPSLRRGSRPDPPPSTNPGYLPPQPPPGRLMPRTPAGPHNPTPFPP